MLWMCGIILTITEGIVLYSLTLKFNCKKQWSNNKKYIWIILRQWLNIRQVYILVSNQVVWMYQVTNPPKKSNLKGRTHYNSTCNLKQINKSKNPNYGWALGLSHKFCDSETWKKQIPVRSVTTNVSTNKPSYDPFYSRLGPWAWQVLAGGPQSSDSKEGLYEEHLRDNTGISFLREDVRGEVGMQLCRGVNFSLCTKWGNLGLYTICLKRYGLL